MHQLTTRRSARRPANEDGAIAILVALFAVALFAFAALVVDVGDAQDVRTQSQSAVDAAALAGVRALASGGDVATAVKSYIEDNVHVDSWSACTDPGHLAHLEDTADPSDQCISSAAAPEASGTAYQVRVKLPPRRIPVSFASAFGAGSIVVSPVSVAESGMPPPCQPCDPAIGSDGQPVGSPSPSPTPAFVSPSPTVSPSPPPPPPSPVTACPSPGTYIDSDVSIPGSCALSAGLYVFRDSNLTVAGALNASDVSLVFEGSSSFSAGGPLTLSATSASGPSVDGVIPGVAIFFDSSDSGTFDLGPNFAIVGNVLGLNATWVTKANECASYGSCLITDGTISVPHTAFADGIVPLVGPSPTPTTPHLSE